MKLTESNPVRIRDALKSAGRYEHSLFLALAEVTFSVKSNSRGLIEYLETYFRDFILSSQTRPADYEIFALEAPSFDVTAGPGRELIPVERGMPGKAVKESYIELDGLRVVKKNQTGLFFIFDRNTHIAAGPCLENANQVVNFVNSRFIQYRLNRKALLLHAAGIQCNGKGMALAGFSGAGKSTLALHIMNHGTSFVSNDRIMIEKGNSGMRMYGVAKMPRINPGTIVHNKSLFSILTREERVRYRSIEREKLWDLEEKHDAFIDEAFGRGRFTLSASFDCLVILNWDRNKNGISCSTVDLATRRDLLPAVMKSSGIFFLKEANSGYIEHTEANYIEYFSGIDVYEITGGCDFEKGADICMEILGR